MMTLTSFETKIAEHRRLTNAINRCAWMRLAGCCKPSRRPRRTAAISSAIATLILTLALLSTFAFI